MLPDIGEWKTVREADNWGGPVLMCRDHDRIALNRTIGAYFDAAQWAAVNEEAERIIAEGRQWLAEKCRCGIASGRPAEVIPPACPVHGVPCEGCGGVEECADNCPEGHPYDEANTYIDPRGYRNCRTCHNERRRSAPKAVSA